MLSTVGAEIARCFPSREGIAQLSQKSLFILQRGWAFPAKSKYNNVGRWPVGLLEIKNPRESAAQSIELIAFHSLTMISRRGPPDMGSN